jgi:hypothetical protein
VSRFSILGGARLLEMEKLFILAVLGHLVGDYMLQTKHMALNKSAKGWQGAITCTIHVAIYSAAVCAFWWTVNPLIFLLVAVPHWLIDRFSLAAAWLKLIRGRTFEAAYLSQDKYREFDIAFTAIVYTVTDNTMHLLCLAAVIYFIPIT